MSSISVLQRSAITKIIIIFYIYNPLTVLTAADFCIRCLQLQAVIYNPLTVITAADFCIRCLQFQAVFEIAVTRDKISRMMPTIIQWGGKRSFICGPGHVSI